MTSEEATGFHRGTVETYDPRQGYGYIEPNEEALTPQLLLVHSRSLRDRTSPLSAGQRVLFRIESVPRGLLAADVHPELEVVSEGDRSAETITGVVARTGGRGFGFIQAEDGRNVFFRTDDTIGSFRHAPVGTSLLFKVKETVRGPQAYDIQLAETDGDDCPSTTGSDHGGLSAQDLLKQALFEKERRNYDRAARLFERGLRAHPSTRLVLSYAAMEKNRGHRDSAMRIYAEGIRRLPHKAKLHEDAGVMAASLGRYKQALDYLERALRVCREYGQPGEKGVLLAIARTYNQLGTLQALTEAVRYYELAIKAFGAGGRFPTRDLLDYEIARIRTQHHRGNLTVQFLRDLGFQVRRASLLEQRTVGADLVVCLDNTELIESYGLSDHLLVRSAFTSSISSSDLKNLQDTVQEMANASPVDEQVVLLAVASVPPGLERMLFQRVESRSRSMTAIIPIPQEVMEERDTPALRRLRDILDRWLYRRDLFAVNAPVVGRRFFGREKALAELREAADRGTATGIFGLRKVGKTSLLKEAQRRSSETGDIAIYIDLLRVPGDVSDARWLYWKIAGELRSRVPKAIDRRITWRLGGRYRDYLGVPRDLPVATAFDADLSQLLDTLAEGSVTPTPRVILLLDEIERLLPTPPDRAGLDGFFDFLSYLRGVSQESGNFVVVVAGANAEICEAAQFECRDNPVFNFFRESYLQLLEENECATMMRELGRGMGIRFERSACGIIHDLTGGHPLFLRQFCSYVAQRYPDRPLSVDAFKIKPLVEEYLEFGGKDFREILDRLARDYPQERDVCVSIARAGGHAPLSDISGGEKLQAVSLRHLVGYQIARVECDTISLTMDLFTRWLGKRCSADGD
ncbi:MAG: cold shock domain-containing protein [Phycisphaerae bacterium]|nr:cold shock domain-containing protein [Phycisphaerae bacterium]